MPARLALAALLIGLLAPALRADEAAERPTREQLQFFEMKIRPLFAERCYECHAGEKHKAGLRLDSLATILAGGDSGPAVVPGSPDESLLVEAVRYESVEMPPSGKLPEAEIATLVEWIALGAPWPPEDGPAPEAAESRGEITDEDRAYWAFQPITRPQVPDLRVTDRAAHPIDAFVLARLEQRGIEPNGPATRRQLARRAYFDLIGLPPSPEEMAAFLADTSPDAYERLIDDLLTRSQYGERWGRHWLDVVRYAQSNGYERDDEKPYAWRYRDYVIRAFNDDKPYDRFIVEQLAGDELDTVTDESLIATGFYRLGIWDDEPDDRRQAKFDALDDILLTTGAAFMGLTVGCARCHDHMFDPMPQEDYYRFLAFFANVREYAVPKRTLDSPVLRPLADAAEIAAWKAQQDERARGVEARLAGLREEIRTQVVAQRLAALSTAPPSDEDIDKAIIASHAEAKQKLDAELKRIREEEPPFEWALCVTEDGNHPPPTHVLVRGNAAQEGRPVEPGFLSVLAPDDPSLPLPIAGGRSTGLRRVAAEWIASADNPLTARVIVNRLWHYHFGRGIVETPDDFGRTGLPPSHPELLDWLAAELIDGGWTLKRMHKLIMTSETYRRSSASDNAEAEAIDPVNELYWRQNLRRLSAEAIRDAVLATSGRLNIEQGGRGVFPRLEREVLAGQSRPGESWGVSSSSQRDRRSVYLFVKRTLLAPWFETFDYANTAAPLGVRPTTTVAPQSLMLLNSDFLHDQALAMADRLVDEAGPDRDAQIARAFALALARQPSAEEVRIARQFIDAQIAASATAREVQTLSPRVPSALHTAFIKQLAPEDFLAAPGPAWSHHKGRWDIPVEGTLGVDPLRGPFVLHHDTAGSDFAVEMSLRLDADSDVAGVLLRGQAAGDEFRGYEVALDPRSRRLAVRRHGDEIAELDGVEVPVQTGTWHRLKIELTGDRVLAWFDEDGEPVLDVVDVESFSGAGHFGLRTWGSALSFRDLVVHADGQTRVIDADASGLPTAERLALKAFCLVVMNLNEFVYID